MYLFGVMLVHIFPAFSRIRSSARKCGKNADQDNSEYGHFLCGVMRETKFSSMLNLLTVQLWSMRNQSGNDIENP